MTYCMRSRKPRSNVRRGGRASNQQQLRESAAHFPSVVMVMAMVRTAVATTSLALQQPTLIASMAMASMPPVWKPSMSTQWPRTRMTMMRGRGWLVAHSQMQWRRQRWALCGCSASRSHHHRHQRHHQHHQPRRGELGGSSSSNAMVIAQVAIVSRRHAGAKIL